MSKSNNILSSEILKDMRELVSKNMMEISRVDMDNKIIKRQLDELTRSVNTTLAILRATGKALYEERERIYAERRRKNKLDVETSESGLGDGKEISTPGGSDTPDREPSRVRRNNTTTERAILTNSNADVKGNRDGQKVKRTRKQRKTKKEKDATQKVGRATMSCSTHPNYHGVRKPKRTPECPSGCATCWKVFHTLNPGA